MFGQNQSQRAEVEELWSGRVMKWKSNEVDEQDEQVGKEEEKDRVNSEESYGQEDEEIITRS